MITLEPALEQSLAASLQLSERGRQLGNSSRGARAPRLVAGERGDEARRPASSPSSSARQGAPGDTAAHQGPPSPYSRGGRPGDLVKRPDQHDRSGPPCPGRCDLKERRWRRPGRGPESLGTDVSELTVLRHGRELSGGLFGFFQTGTLRDRESRETPLPAAARPPGPAPARRPCLQPAPRPSRATGHRRSRSPRCAPRGHDRHRRRVVRPRAQGRHRGRGGGRVRCRRDIGPHLWRSVARDRPWPAPPTPHEEPRTIRLGVAEASSVSLGPAREAGLAEEYLPDPFFSQPGAGAAAAARHPSSALSGPVPSPGDVLVLVGDVDESVKIAEQVARRIDEEEAVIVVSHRRLSPSPARLRARSPLEAGTMVLKRRLAGLVSIVVLDSLCREGFVPSTVAGLRPDATWAVVPASWDETRTRRSRGPRRSHRRPRHPRVPLDATGPPA